jgi:hypothetical protein
MPVFTAKKKLGQTCSGWLATHCTRGVEEQQSKDNKRQDYAFWRPFNEKPCVILGCPGRAAQVITQEKAQIIIQEKAQMKIQEKVQMVIQEEAQREA